ncbi:UNVERIFIED_CONTAM: hypothetical protein K2H54_018019 [Gekko kuhli]
MSCLSRFIIPGPFLVLHEKRKSADIDTLAFIQQELLKREVVSPQGGAEKREKPTRTLLGFSRHHTEGRGETEAPSARTTPPHVCAHMHMLGGVSEGRRLLTRKDHICQPDPEMDLE